MHYTSRAVFTFDFMALLGAATINPKRHIILQLCGFGKMIRIKRFGRFIDSLNMRVTLKSFLNFFKIMLYIALYLHIVTCFWVYVVDIYKDSY